MRRLDLIGMTFGRLTVLEDLPGGTRSRRYVRCSCACGSEAVVSVGKLRSGETRSCGCLRREVGRSRRLRHGESRAVGITPEYRAWCNMNNRCYNERNPVFADYGGRGIRVCSRWRASYASFLSDVGRRPSMRHTLGRKDNDGNYEPGNVEWQTWTEQQRNRRGNRLVEIDGERLTIAEWSERSGVDAGTIAYRLRSGRTARCAVFSPVERRAS